MRLAAMSFGLLTHLLHTPYVIIVMVNAFAIIYSVVDGRLMHAFMLINLINWKTFAKMFC